MSQKNYTVQTKIKRPASEVYEAIVTGEILCRYFTSEVSGDLKEGAVVYWSWHDYEKDLPVTVSRLVTNKTIELSLNSRDWEKTKDTAYDVRVTFELTAIDDSTTLLAISEQGWLTDEEGLKASHDNCEGWTHMAICLKAWLEHELDLR